MKRILVVDDSKTIRTLLKRTLLTGGFDIAGEAQDGPGAVETFQRVRPDLMTIDLNIPDMDGLSVIRRIREGCPDAKILVISAIAQPAVEREARDAGAIAVLPKPVTDAGLLEAVNGAFAGL